MPLYIVESYRDSLTVPSVKWARAIVPANRALFLHVIELDATPEEVAAWPNSVHAVKKPRDQSPRRAPTGVHDYWVFSPRANGPKKANAHWYERVDVRSTGLPIDQALLDSLVGESHA